MIVYFDFSYQHPSFLGIVGKDLIVTSFSGDPFVKGSVWIIPDATNLNVSSFAAKKLFGGLEWPNNVSPVPNSNTNFVFGDGFLVPGERWGVFFCFVSHIATFKAKPRVVCTLDP